MPLDDFFRAADEQQLGRASAVCKWRGSPRDTALGVSAEELVVVDLDGGAELRHIDLRPLGPPLAFPPNSAHQELWPHLLAAHAVAERVADQSVAKLRTAFDHAYLSDELYADDALTEALDEAAHHPKLSAVGPLPQW